MYAFQSRVRYSEVGEDKKLTLNGIINYFQDCSTFQSEMLRVGVDRLEKLHLVWVLSSWQIVVERYPALCEEITIGTWPYDFDKFAGYRNFIMKDKEGRRIAWANSLWVLLNTDTGIPTRMPEELWKAYTLEERLDMQYASRKVSLPGECEAREPFAVQKHHLDTNHHVNNGQYIQMARDYLPEDFEVHQMRAEYKKSALPGDTIYPVVASLDAGYTVGLCDELGRPYAVVELT